MSATGVIYDIQGYSVHDGPGIRTTVFLKGCPLSCPWCHSPESQSFVPQVCFKKTGCMGLDSCTHCIEVCPNGAISDAAEIDGDKRLPSRAPTAAPASKHARPRHSIFAEGSGQLRMPSCASCATSPSTSHPEAA